MLSRENKKCISICIAVPVLLPAIHIVTYSQHYFYSIRLILTMAAAAAWMITVEKRVLSARIRKYMLLLGCHLVLYLFATMIKQNCFATDAAIVRYIWYGSYIPMTAVPLYTFLTAFNMGREDPGAMRRLKLLRVPELLLIAGVMTNDLHRLAFSFPSGIELGEHSCRHEILYWIVFAWNICLYAAALVTMLKRCRLAGRKKYIWIPLIPLVLGAVYFLVDIINTDLIRVNGSRIYSIAEVFVLMEIGFMEACIQIGLISSNSMYGRFFAGAGFPAVIQNAKGKLIYRTAGPWPYADDQLPDQDGSRRLEGGGKRLSSVPVSGGRLIYEEDVSALEKLGESIRKETEQIESRNLFLTKQNEIREENARIKAASDIYDRMEEIAGSRRLELEALLNGAEDLDGEEFRMLLARVCVLNAYIKRRSNMELLAAERNGRMPLAEMISSAAESLEYTKLFGTETVLLQCADADRELASAEAAALYEGLETVLERSAGHVRFMTVGFSENDGKTELRIMLSPAPADPEGYVSGIPLKLHTECSGQDLDIRMSCGGEGV